MKMLLIFLFCFCHSRIFPKIRMYLEKIFLNNYSLNLYQKKVTWLPFLKFHFLITFYPVDKLELTYEVLQMHQPHFVVSTFLYSFDFQLIIITQKIKWKWVIMSQVISFLKYLELYNFLLKGWTPLWPKLYFQAYL